MWRTTTHLVVVLLSSFCRFNLNTIHHFLHNFQQTSTSRQFPHQFLTCFTPLFSPIRQQHSNPFFFTSIFHHSSLLRPPFTSLFSTPPPEHPSGHRPGGPIAIRGRGQIGGARETLPLGGCPHHFWKALGEFHLSKSREKI